MQGILSLSNLKLFSKSLHSLLKLGQDVTIDQNAQSLTFRTLNNSQSSLAQVTLKASFFTNYLCSTSEPIRCKLNLKNFLSCMHSLANVERAHFKLNAVTNCAFIEMECKHGIRRKFTFSFEEQTQILQADFSRESCPNRIFMEPASIELCLSNFHSALDQITIVPTKSHMVLKSFTEDRMSLSLQTEFCIDTKELYNYEIENYDVKEVTFGAEELKAIFSYCKYSNSTLYFFFDIGGVPMLISNSESVDSPLVLDMIISTMKLDPIVQKAIATINTRISTNFHIEPLKMPTQEEEKQPEPNEKVSQRVEATQKANTQHVHESLNVPESVLIPPEFDSNDECPATPDAED